MYDIQLTFLIYFLDFYYDEQKYINKAEPTQIQERIMHIKYSCLLGQLKNERWCESNETKEQWRSRFMRKLIRSIIFLGFSTTTDRNTRKVKSFPAILLNHNQINPQTNLGSHGIELKMKNHYIKNKN